jgi:hypothetical protein
MSEAAEATRDQFDFWIGDWVLSWEGGTGRNRVSSVLDGAVILEEFSADPPEGLRGMSVSTVSSETGGWRQTWVDNSSGYLDFTGGMRDGEMVLEREGLTPGAPVRQRMVWADITPNALTWRWERSDDEGATWRTLWLIRYRRTVPG